MDAAPLAILFPPPRFVFDSTSAPKDVKINIVVDATGALIGGTPGDDLVVIGAVDTTGDSVLDTDGVLLTGEVTAFGFLDSGGPTDTFDFAFTVTGGALAPFYAGKGIGVTLTSEGSSFTGSFTVNFGEGRFEFLQSNTQARHFFASPANGTDAVDRGLHEAIHAAGKATERRKYCGVPFGRSDRRV